jgi:type IV secretory pathway VirB10-like protein
MNRPILVMTFFAVAAAALGAQQASQSGPYQGVSNPPPDDTIVTTSTPQAKPPAGHPAYAPAPAAAQAQQTARQTDAGNSSANDSYPARNSATPSSLDGTDGGIVMVAQPQSALAQPGVAQPALTQRSYAPDPDGDIVHLAPLGPGEIREGTMIRVRLLGDLSSALSEPGQAFRSRVASDVLEGGQVLIPAGAEIDGKVAEASTGHFGGHGSLLLRPETVILPNGSSYRLHAVVSGTPMTNTNVGLEGVISPGGRMKRNGIEYGGAVGAGAVTGAYLGGPVGALAGGLIGAGLVTTHLLVSHPQTHLDEGDVLILTLTQRMHLDPAAASGN